MRLTELEPHWFTFGNPATGVTFLIGLTFLCPHCRSQRLGVRFEPAIDPNNVGKLMSPQWPFGDGPFWHREGDTFDTLTLSPSIDASGYEMDFKGHWHGFITNGEIK